MELVLLWLLFGAIAAAIAHSRGGSGCLAFAVGMLLGPFGIIAAFFFGGEKERDGQLLAQGSRKKCPMCAELVQPEARICRHCGHNFESPEDIKHDG